MIAQAYYSDPLGMCIRIFPHGVIRGIADLPLNASTPTAADESLRAMNLRRGSAWESWGGGMQATVYFVAPVKRRAKK